MKCGDKAKEMMVDLASGELHGIAKWRLLRHVTVCDTCRAEWEGIQQLWQGLGALSVSPVTQTAGHAAINRMNAASTRPISRKGGVSMKKRVIILAIAAVLVLAAGAFAEDYINSPEGGSVTGHGHAYKVVGNFRGMVKLYDQDNQLVGTIGTGTAMGGGDPVHGKVKITADGKDFQFAGPGRYEMRDPNGLLHGYAELVPTTDQQVAQQLATYNSTPSKFEDLVPWVQAQVGKSNAENGGGGGPFYIYGFDNRKGTGYFWLLQGIGNVATLDPSGRQTADGGQTGLMTDRELAMMRAVAPKGINLTPDEIKNPRIAIIVNGKTTYEQGYGAYQIRDANGELLATIKANPPDWQK